MTKVVPLSRGYVAQVDDADHARVLEAGPWHVKPHGHLLYAARNVRRPEGGWTSQSLHRFLTGWVRVDHHNGDGLDNRRANLRPATAAQNAANARLRATSVSGFKGVFPNTSGGLPWRAEIRCGETRRYLGVFGDPAVAARAYDAAACELFGEFARLNFPSEGAA